MKRLLTVTLCLALLCTLLPAKVLAEDLPSPEGNEFPASVPIAEEGEGAISVPAEEVLLTEIIPDLIEELESASAPQTPVPETLPADTPLFPMASNPSTYTFDISGGPITVSKAAEAGQLTVTYGNPAVTTDPFANTQQITVIGSSSSCGVIVSIGVTANITLNDLQIDQSGIDNSCAFDMTGASVNLNLTGNNILRSGQSRAGLEVPGGSAVTIAGEGKLDARGGQYGAGIGSYLGISGIVTINGGAITATGGQWGAGIGGGFRSTGGITTINGGIVTAAGGPYGAGIGGGREASGGTTSITGGTVTAIGGQWGSGIGGGYLGQGDHTVIRGGLVAASGGTDGAGIGGGSGGNGGHTAISGGTVTTSGGFQAAGIGGGYGGHGGHTIISGGTVTAKGGQWGAGIGGGCDGNGGHTTISGGTVTANGGQYSAGIGSACTGQDSGVQIISGGTVTATGGENSAGIGGGYFGGGGSVYISGGSIKAEGDSQVKGIGQGLVASRIIVKNKPASEGGVDIFPTTVALSGAAGNTAVKSLTTDLDYSYGVKDVCTMEDKLFLYLPANQAVTGARTSGEAYYGNVSSGTSGGSGTFQLHDLFVDAGTGYSYIDGLLTFTHNGSYTVSMATPGTVTTTDRIAVQGGVTANIILDSVKIDRSVNMDAAFDLTGATVNLTITGSNSLKGGHHRAGLEAITGSLLTIDGSGALEAKGGASAAGIGGGLFGNSGNICINGGTVTATGSLGGGAGVGGGFNGSGGRITISGGTVNAMGGGSAAGIGAEQNSFSGTFIIISGGTIKATGGSAGAGIGGECTDTGHILISGGTITATGGAGSAGIGTSNSRMGHGGPVVITGGSVRAKGGAYDISVIPTNGGSYGNMPVRPVEIGLPGCPAGSEILNLEITGAPYYGFNDMFADEEGKLYLWLPPDASLLDAETADDTYEDVPVVFTTYTDKPEIFSLTPSGTDALLAGHLVIEFNTSMREAAGTVCLNGSPLTGGSWNANLTVFTLPYSGLAYSTSYEVRVTGFRDFWGNVMEDDQSRSFTTTGPPVSLPLVTTHPEVSSITDSGAEVRGSVSWDGGDSISERGFVYSRDANPRIGQADVIKVTAGQGSGDFMSALTGLIPGSVYYVAAYAINSAGTGYGQDVTFTSDDLPLLMRRTLTDPVTGISVSGIIHRDARLVVEDLSLDDDPACRTIRDYMEDYAWLLLLGKNIQVTEGYSGSLAVTIPLDPAYNGQTVTILHCAEGLLESFTATAVDGKVEIDVTDLSPLAVFAKAGTHSLPTTGENHINRLAWFFFTMAALTLTAGLALERKKKEAGY